MKNIYECHNLTNTRLYTIWKNIKYRCKNLNNTNYKNYGGRGISICKEWDNSFKAFYSWAIPNGYQDNLTIDRINNDGNYEPSNCRWAAKNIQARNTKLLNTRNKTGYRGVTKFKKQYRARIIVDNKAIFLGYFVFPIDAAIAYDNFVKNNNLQHTLNF